jgi:hypothetical protein
MSNETENKQDPTGSVNPGNTKTDPSQRTQRETNPPQDISKKNPSQDSDSQHKGQEKPEDEKRRAS